LQKIAKTHAATTDQAHTKRCDRN